jgi:hypothetical protein
MFKMRYLFVPPAIIVVILVACTTPCQRHLDQAKDYECTEEQSITECNAHRKDMYSQALGICRFQERN